MFEKSTCSLWKINYERKNEVQSRLKTLGFFKKKKKFESFQVLKNNNWDKLLYKNAVIFNKFKLKKSKGKYVYKNDFFVERKR